MSDSDINNQQEFQKSGVPLPALLSKYFPDLSEKQVSQYVKLASLCREWNEKINIISRKDIDQIDVNHILHSLSIAKFIKFEAESVVIDLGTGGGFPGLPLAIMFPDVRFHLVDRIGKKLKVAENIAGQIGLSNVTFQHGDFGECKIKADFIVSRAVMPQPDLVKLARKNISGSSFNALPNGLISLKGGELHDELKSVVHTTEVVDIDNYFDEPYFKTKKIVYTQI